MKDNMAYRGKLIVGMTIPELSEALNETEERLESNQFWITPISFENYTNDVQCLWQIKHYLAILGDIEL